MKDHKGPNRMNVKKNMNTRMVVNVMWAGIKIQNAQCKIQWNGMESVTLSLRIWKRSQLVQEPNVMPGPTFSLAVTIALHHIIMVITMSKPIEYYHFPCNIYHSWSPQYAI